MGIHCRYRTAVQGAQVSFSLGTATAVLIFSVLSALMGGFFVTAWMGAKQNHLSALTAYDWHIVRFTLFQALASAVISTVCAVPVARCLARFDFYGRGFVLLLLGLPFVVPVLTGGAALLLIFGQAGIINNTLVWFRLPRINIYGAHGIIMAHVFFNLPLAIRLLWQSWQAIPQERWRLAASLGFNRRAEWIYIERPLLMATLPAIAALIFMVCCSSFAIALLLGGGPKATTIELSIYQALRFDFNLPYAARFAMIQITIVACALLVCWCLTYSRSYVVHSAPGFLQSNPALAAMRAKRTFWDAIDGVIVFCAVLFLSAPLLALCVRGLSQMSALPWAVIMDAVLRSLLLSFLATVLVLVLALPMSMRIAANQAHTFVRTPYKRNVLIGHFVSVVGYMPLVVSSMILASGALIVLMPFIDTALWALPLSAASNALVSLPFAMRILTDKCRIVYYAHADRSAAVGVVGWRCAVYIVVPQIAAEIGLAAGLTAAFSVGDLGAIAVFASPQENTLPLLMYRLLGSYRYTEAAGVISIMLLLSCALFFAGQSCGRILGKLWK